jgi:hypothetical protein
MYWTGWLKVSSIDSFRAATTALQDVLEALAEHGRLLR